MLRLGVNIDHVATIRNARGGEHPDPVRAARQAAESGADGITAHLREDRRHITDKDIDRLMAEIDLPLNLEMAATPEMLDIALRHKPHAVCLVPEKREERTTEGGLDIAAGHNHLAPYVRQLDEAGIRVSLFIEADPVQIAVAEAMGASVVELHTGAYCDAFARGDKEAVAGHLELLKVGASEAFRRGLEVHAGHGLTYETVKPIAAIRELMELNIGHFLIGEAIFRGLREAVTTMRGLIVEARDGADLSA
ncbi:pyridoxine 5'-phosphate synthase [Maricaulis sp.]|uniref:pyridoxine 5'-phosphate synthase n=1 Tax=Maricaulis sp. TaxID=1486257 RepID=UPI003A925DC5